MKKCNPDTMWLRSYLLGTWAEPSTVTVIFEAVLCPSSQAIRCPGVFSVGQGLPGFTRRWTDWGTHIYGCSRSFCKWVIVSLNKLVCLLEEMKCTWMNKWEMLPPLSSMTKFPFQLWFLGRNHNVVSFPFCIQRMFLRISGFMKEVQRWAKARGKNSCASNGEGQVGAKKQADCEDGYLWMWKKSERRVMFSSGLSWLWHISYNWDLSANISEKQKETVYRILCSHQREW